MDENFDKPRNNGDRLGDIESIKSSSCVVLEDKSSTHEKMQSLVDNATEIATIVAISDEIMSNSKSSNSTNLDGATLDMESESSSKALE